MKGSKSFQEWIQQNKEKVERIINESDSVEQFRMSINETTGNKFREEVDYLAIYAKELQDKMKDERFTDEQRIFILKALYSIYKLILESTLKSRLEYDLIRNDPSKISRLFYSDIRTDDTTNITKIKNVVDDKIVTNNKDDDGEYIEIDYSKLKSNQNYIVNCDNQEYIVRKLRSGKVLFTEVRKQ